MRKEKTKSVIVVMKMNVEGKRERGKQKKDDLIRSRMV